MIQTKQLEKEESLIAVVECECIYCTYLKLRYLAPLYFYSTAFIWQL